MRCVRSVGLAALAYGLLAGPVTAGDPGSNAGPRITYLGIVSSSDVPVPHEPRLEGGRRVYVWPQGHGFSLVVEARSGPDFHEVGIHTFMHDPGDPRVLPDLQILVSHPLGNGNLAVCEIADDAGVPGNPALAYDESQAVADAINDLGCRFDDGEGGQLGRMGSENACTKSPQTFDYGFVEPATSVQFCAVIARTWAFAAGDTIVAARARDEDGNVGPRQEIIVRIGSPEPSPSTPTPTATVSRTALPTATPRPPCPGDCNGNGAVTIEELVRGVNIALDRLPASACPALDSDRSTTVTINELTAAVRSLMNGCSN